MANNGLATTVHTAAMPSSLRSMVNSWQNSLPENTVQMAKLHASALLEGVRGTGEAGVMGSILGAFHALSPTGLDIPIPGTKLKAPADFLGAVLGLVGGVGAATAPHGMGKTVANAGFACSAVFGFRQTNDLIALLKRRAAGATAGGGAQVAGAVTISKAAFGAERGQSESHRKGGIIGREKGNSGNMFAGEDPIVAMARNCQF